MSHLQRRVFERYDKNGNGVLEKFELRTLLAHRGRLNDVHPREYKDKVDEEFAKADRNEDGVVSFAEFQAFLLENGLGSGNTVEDNEEEEVKSEETKASENYIENLRKTLDRPNEKRKSMPSQKGILMKSDATQRISKNNKVRFAKNVQIKFLPEEEWIAARRSRQGIWDPAPDDDELWDGELQDFRNLPLTEKEFKNLEKQKQMTFFQNTYAMMSGLDDVDSYLGDYEDLGEGSREPMVEWSVEQVGEWMRVHVPGGEYFAPILEECGIDGENFLSMGEKDLRNIGIRKKSSRKDILQARDLFFAHNTTQTY